MSKRISISKKIAYAEFATIGLAGVTCIVAVVGGKNNQESSAIASLVADEWMDESLNSPSPPKPEGNEPVDNSPSEFKNEESLTGVTSTASRLFASMHSPGNIAVAVAEGNKTPEGRRTSLYNGHTDPGNLVTNRGYCSWNKAKRISVSQADKNCLNALQRQSAATERKLRAQGIDPKNNVTALVNGTDIWNQSNSAGPQFAKKYKLALSRNLKGDRAILFARVESFRRSSGKLSASGLYRICRTQSAYIMRLRGLAPDTERWQWVCISLDQGRRVKELTKTLKVQRQLGRLGSLEQR